MRPVWFHSRLTPGSPRRDTMPKRRHPVRRSGPWPAEGGGTGPTTSSRQRPASFRRLSARERSRQPEGWEDAVLEAGHGAYPVTGEGEDVEAHPVADATGRAQIGSERRLAVGSCRHEVKPPPRGEDVGAEASYEVSAHVFEGHRWHRDEDIVGQEGHQR